MRTNIVLDDALVAEAMRLTKARSKREVVDLALRELLAKHHSRALVALRGTPALDPAYDVREVRARMGEKAQCRDVG